MSVKSKLVGILAVLVLFIAGSSLLTDLSISKQETKLLEMEKAADKAADQYVPLLVLAKDIKVHVIQVQQWLTDISATRGLDGLNDGIDLAAEHAAGFREKVTGAREIAVSLGLDEAVSLLDRAAAEFTPYHESGIAMARAYMAEGPAAGNRLMGSFDETAARLGETTDALVDLVTETTNNALRAESALSHEIAETNHSLLITLLIITAFGIVIAVAGALYLYRLVGQGLANLETDIHTVADDDASKPMLLDPARSDEFGMVARALAEFRTQLQEVARLKAEQEELEKRQAEALRKERNDMADSLDQEVSETITKLLGNADEIIGAVSSVGQKLDDSSNRSLSVAEAADRTNENVSMVASATEELAASIAEIARQVETATSTAVQAEQEANATNQDIQGLAEAAVKIGEVVALITDIAEQTNLLALNATIEAARAGEAGKGFAVVASEVKNLATQTARATEQISGQISGIQTSTNKAVKSIEDITSTIQEVNSVSAGIAAAITEQRSATDEIARNIQLVSEDSQMIATSITGVTQSTSSTYGASIRMLWAAQDLVGPCNQISDRIKAFITRVRAG